MYSASPTKEEKQHLAVEVGLDLSEGFLILPRLSLTQNKTRTPPE